MLSESQERMLVFVKTEHEEDIRRLFQHWEIRCDIIGKVTDDGYTPTCGTATRKMVTVGPRNGVHQPAGVPP